MTPLIPLIIYICDHSNSIGFVLSKARLVKLIYLIDWKSSIDNLKQVTDIEWIFNHYGPYVIEIIKEIEDSPYLNIEKYVNSYGNIANKILVNNSAYKNKINKSINEDDRKIIDYVLSVTKHMTYTDFLRLVYSTYPILKSNRQDKMDLVHLASDYKNFKKSTDPLNNR